jgi:hypothetical protein
VRAGAATIYIKSILAGLAATVLSLALLVAATIFISMRGIYKESAGLGAVAGGVTFNSPYISGVVLLLGGVIVFTVGFTWEFRRSLRKASTR